MRLSWEDAEVRNRAREAVAAARLAIVQTAQQSRGSGEVVMPWV